LNLQNGGSTIVWFGLCWSLEYYLQFNARLHRQGQIKTVVVHHVVATGTIDEIVMEALSSKNISQNQLLVGLKDLISNNG
jgi:SNF2 family DNA or RNA helicase